MEIMIEKFGKIYFHNYINLDVKNKMLALEMRNSLVVREWMYGQDIILEDEHCDFIENLQENIRKSYFLVERDNIIIGSVNFSIEVDSLGEFALFGFYSNPFEKVLGVGRILELASFHYVFNIIKLNVLRLEVFAENKQVVNLHQKFGFKIFNIKRIKNKEVYCMEKIR